MMRQRFMPLNGPKTPVGVPLYQLRSIIIASLEFRRAGECDSYRGHRTLARYFPRPDIKLSVPGSNRGTEDASPTGTKGMNRDSRTFPGYSLRLLHKRNCRHYFTCLLRKKLKIWNNSSVHHASRKASRNEIFFCSLELQMSKGDNFLSQHSKRLDFKF